MSEKEPKINRLGKYGKKGGPGRPKGTPRSYSLAFIRDCHRAYSQSGGKNWLRDVARNHPKDFLRAYSKLMEKCLPQDVNLTGEVKHVFDENLRLIEEAVRNLGEK